MAGRLDSLPNDVLYQVCALVLRQKKSMVHVTDWLKANGYPTAKREWPRKMLAEAYDRELLVLPAIEDFEIATRIQNHTGALCRVSAVEDHQRATFESLAELAADQVLHLVRQVEDANREIDQPRRGIHIGLAAGGTTQALATRLARKLEIEPNLPQLWLHTLTSGFFVNNPDTAPVVSLGEFKNVKPAPEYVVLHSVPIVASNKVAELRKAPFTGEAFDAAKALDIVVTSVSVADHAHSLFRLAVQAEDPQRAKQRITYLKGRKWAGDIMWQPYSTAGDALDCGVRAVSVVDFDDLVRLANHASKFVVCIAGPCADCGMSKEKAVLPLIKRAKTHRPFDHLVTTQSTARAICKALRI